MRRCRRGSRSTGSDPKSAQVGGFRGRFRCGVSLLCRSMDAGRGLDRTWRFVCSAAGCGLPVRQTFARAGASGTKPGRGHGLPPGQNPLPSLILALLALFVGLREAGTGLTPSWRAEARHPRLGCGLHPRKAWMPTFVGMTFSRSAVQQALTNDQRHKSLNLRPLTSFKKSGGTFRLAPSSLPLKIPVETSQLAPTDKPINQSPPRWAEQLALSEADLAAAKPCPRAWCMPPFALR